MKLNKNTLVLVGVCILLAVFIYLSASHSQQVEGQEKLNGEISLVKQRLNIVQVEQLSSQLESMNDQLSRATSDIEASKAMLSEEVKSVDISDRLLEIAGISGVEVTSIISPGRGTDDLEGIICSILPLTVEVKGEISNIITFVSALNNSLTTGVVKTVDIKVSKEEGPSASVSLVIYTYESMPVKIVKSTKGS